MNKKIEVDRTKLLEKLIKKSPKILITNLSSSDPNIKFTSSKALIKISETNPQKLYANFDEFVSLFKSENNFIKWTGIIIIGNLAKIDKNDNIDKILPELFSKLNTGKMITANNTIEALSKIALAKTKLQNKITSELLKIKYYKYDTVECNNIAIGHVINAFILYLKNPDKKVLNFIKNEIKNTRHSTSEKAKNYLKKYE